MRITIVFFKLTLIFSILGLSNLSNHSVAICPGVQCPGSCYGIEGSDCTCLPKGCDEIEPTLSTDAAKNPPFCVNGKVNCKSGKPVCKSFIRIPTCGSNFGFTGKLSGPGCTNRARSLIDLGAVSCKTIDDLAIEGLGCTKKGLCKNLQSRKKPCRVDRLLCKCVCPFEIRKQKHTPICNLDDIPFCAKHFIPTCTNPDNIPKCDNGKLFCFNVPGNFADLADKIICQKVSL